MGSNISHSPAETEALGESWGRTAVPGLVIALSGDLGAGKTQLVRGLARGLGITARVHSPTFALLNVYSGGRLELNHIDLYRLETPEQVASAGLDDYLEPAGVTVIEWAERWLDRASVVSQSAPGTPRKLRWAAIAALGEMERRIDYEDFGF
jgi:tRNA threonylcarbamoyladenosine biosynthesis protein TsaE